MAQANTGVDEPTSELPGGILGIDAYKHDDSGVTDVQVIERASESHGVRWLGGENRVDGVGTPEGWVCVGACSVEWGDERDDWPKVPVEAEAVYVNPDADEWTSVPLSLEVDA